MSNKSLFSIFLLCISCAGKELIVVKSAQASSVLGPKKGDRFAAANLIDKTNRSWCEGAKDFGKDVTLSFELQKPDRVSHLYIRNGYGWGQYWADNNRVKELRIEGGKGDAAVVTLQDTDELQEVKFPKLSQSDTLKMSILSVYPGAKGNDTCITEIAFNKQDDYDTSFTLDIPKTDWRILEKVGDRFWGIIQKQGRYDQIDNLREVEEYRIEMNLNGRILAQDRLQNESVKRMIALSANRIFIHKRLRAKESTYENGKAGEEIQENKFLLLDGTGHLVDEIQLENRLVIEALRTHDGNLLLVSAGGKYPQLEIAAVNISGKVHWKRTILNNVQLPPPCLSLSEIQVRLRKHLKEGLVLSAMCDTLRYKNSTESVPSFDKTLILALDRNFEVEWQHVIQPSTESYPGPSTLIINGIAELDGKFIAVGNLFQYSCPAEQSIAYVIGQDQTTEIETDLSGRQADAAIRYGVLHQVAPEAITIFGTRLEPYPWDDCDRDDAKSQKFSYFSIDIDTNGREISRKSLPGLPILFAGGKLIMLKSDDARRPTVKNDWDVSYRTPAQKIFKVTRDGRMLVL